jgi:hypothetical protein
VTPVYAIARKVHAELGRHWKHWFLEAGWTKQPGASCAFVRPAVDQSGQWLLWVQVSQWGNSDLGNNFTINLEFQVDPEVFPGSEPESRVLRTLSEEDRALGLAIEATIVARKPIPAPDRKIHEFIRQDCTGQLQAAWTRAFAPQPDRWKPGSDPWLEYFSLEDVRDWGAFLIARMDYFTHRSQSAS